MDDLSGQVMKGYELRERVDIGGFGAVYRAFQRVVGREVAVKIILPQYANHPDFIRRFEVEAHLVARLEHPHIVPLYDYWRDPDGAYLVMRWLRGGNLYAKLESGPLDLPAVIRLLDQIGAALAAAHRRGVVHRDLKPGNILLDEDGNAYLADFGIAKDLGNVNGAFQTLKGAVVGSPAYLSPEQIEGRLITPQTDIYSLGVMLYEVLTGELPFKSTTPVGFYFKHIHDPVPPLRDQRPDLPETLNSVIQRATAKNPADRYPDMPSLIEDLRRALIVGTETPGAPLPTTPPAPGLPYPAQGNGRGVRNTMRITTGYETAVYVAAAAIEVAAPEAENPYKGLRAFQEADAADFFGRASLTQHLLARFGKPSPLAHFLAVVGPSGSGKSSVVRAGLIPAIRRGALPGSDRWFMADMLPGARPLEELATALLSVAVHRPVDLLEQLQQDEYGLLRVIKHALPADTPLLLLIDQFEETFTLVEDEATRSHFLNSLLAAVTAPGSPLRLLITLRADFYDRPLLYPGFSELIRRRTEVVIPLGENELREAIVKPPERVGVTVEPELVTAIIRDVDEQPGSLPLLQYVLTELFARRTGSRLTLESYHASGGVLGALARRADELYAGLSAPAQAAAQQLFLRLVTLGEGTEDTRRRVPRAELASIAGAGEVLDQVITEYTKYRLLTFDRDPITRAPTVEVAHEALIRTWGRLRQWLDASRDDLRMQRRLAAAAAEWISAGRDTSFLATGARLEQFDGWAKETHLALNQDEQAYLDASMAERAARRAQEEARTAHEAALERRSRQVLRALVVVLLVATLGALGLTGVAVSQSQIAQRNAATAIVAQGQAQAEAQNAQNNAATASAAEERARISAAETQNLAIANGAQAALSQGNTDRALTLALIANNTARTAPEAQRILSEAAYAPGTRRRLVGHSSHVLGVVFSPDGKTALSASRDKTLMLWDLATGKAIRSFEGHKDSVQEVAFSPDGKTAVSAGNDELLILWDVNTGKEIRRFEPQPDHGDAFGVAFSPDGTAVLSGFNDGIIVLWEAASGQELRQFKGHTQPVQAVAFSPDGKMALSGSEDQSVILWDVATGQELRRFEGHTRTVGSVAFSPDGKTALSGSEDNTLALWDVATGQELRRLRGHTREVFSVAFSPDGRMALSGSRDGRLGLWDVATGASLRFLVGHGGAVRAVAWSPDGATILSGSEDNTLRLWDVANGAELQRYAGHTDRVNRVVFSPDGKMALSGSGDTTIMLWDLATGKLIRRYEGHNKPIGTLAFRPDGRIFVSGSTDQTVLVWDVATGNILLGPLTGHTKEVSASAFSPDGKTFLTGGGDNVIIQWDAATGQEVRRYEGHTKKINSLAFSPDGQAALSASQDTTLILWDVATGKPIRTFKGHTANVRSAVLSSDGTRALSGGEDNTVILWEVASGKAVQTFRGHNAQVWQVAFSPDGKTGLSASDDLSIILWDLASGQPIRRYLGHTASVRDVAFSADGQTFLSGSNDTSIILWRVDTLEQLIAWANANRYIPELTCDQRELYKLEPCKAEQLTPTPAP